MKNRKPKVPSNTTESEAFKRTIFSRHIYLHGAHAGNVHFEIEIWGMNSPARGAEIKRNLDEFISVLQVDWTGS